MQQKPNLSAKLSNSAIQDLTDICQHLDISKTEAVEQSLSRFAQELGVKKMKRYYLENIDWSYIAQVKDGVVVDAWAVEGAGKQIANIDNLSETVRRRLVCKTEDEIKRLGYKPAW